MAVGRYARFLVPDPDATSEDYLRQSLVSLLAGSSGDLTAVATRDPKHRRGYLGKIELYANEVCGIDLSNQQRSFLNEDLPSQHLIILYAGNGMGKSFLLAILVVYFMDVVAAKLSLAGNQEGARVVLVAPGWSGLKSNLWKDVSAVARAAERKGYAMPGRRGDVNNAWWNVPGYPGWSLEPKSPPKKAGERQAHAAAGSHHPNQLWILDEAPGLPQVMWDTAKGSCMGASDIIIASGNPTDVAGPFSHYARSGSGWTTVRWIGFEHENVRLRATVIPGAISHKKVETRIRDECLDLGPYPEVSPRNGDQFVYALPSKDQPDLPGPRDDGWPGHPLAELRVFQARGNFAASVLGDFPQAVEKRLLFPAADWDEAVRRWRKRQQDARWLTMPDRLGIDPAREGGDDATYAPAWGLTAFELLKRYHEALDEGDHRTLDDLRSDRLRIFCGSIGVLDPGDGIQMANALAEQYPLRTHPRWIIDAVNEGYSLFDQANRNLRKACVEVHFGGGAPEPRLPSEPLYENLRAAIHYRASLLVRYGLVDPPDDELLREEAVTLSYVSLPRSDGEKRVEVISLLPKKEHKKLLPGSRSPDRLDAWVLSLHDEILRDPYEWMGVT